MAQSDLLWPTLLHEIFHCFSVGRSPDASLEFSGYEEGTVEQLQCLFREEIIESLSVSVVSNVFVDRDTYGAYTDYVLALEAMRVTLSMEAKPFYRWLIALPLEQRWAMLREQAEQLPDWTQPDFRRRWRQWERTLRGEVE